MVGKSGMEELCAIIFCVTGTNKANLFVKRAKERGMERVAPLPLKGLDGLLPNLASTFMLLSRASQTQDRQRNSTATDDHGLRV